MFSTRALAQAKIGNLDPLKAEIKAAPVYGRTGDNYEHEPNSCGKIGNVLRAHEFWGRLTESQVDTLMAYARTIHTEK